MIRPITKPVADKYKQPTWNSTPSPPSNEIRPKSAPAGRGKNKSHDAGSPTRSAADEARFAASLDSPIARKEIVLVPQDPADHLPWQKEDERAQRKGYMQSLTARKKDCFRGCIQPEGRMSLQWTEDRQEVHQISDKTEREQIETYTGKPMRRKCLSKEISRYENRTQQKLLQVKYHTNAFLALVNTYEQNRKKEEQLEANRANNPR